MKTRNRFAKPSSDSDSDYSDEGESSNGDPDVITLDVRGKSDKSSGIDYGKWDNLKVEEDKFKGKFKKGDTVRIVDEEGDIGKGKIQGPKRSDGRYPVIAQALSGEVLLLHEDQLRAPHSKYLSAADYKKRGNKCFKEKNYKQAIAEYTYGIDKDPKNHILYSNRSACHGNLGAWKQAENDANMCIKLAPEFGKGYSRKGAALIHMKKWPEAKHILQLGLKRDPGSKAMREYLGVAMRGEKNIENKDDDDDD